MDNVRKTYKQGISQEFVDEETGELIRQTVVTERVEGYVDLKLPEKHKLNNGNFIILFQKSMLEIALNNHLFTRSEMTILFYLLGTAGIGNSIYCDYPTLIEDLGIKRENCVTALNSLIRKGLVLKKSTGSRQKRESALMNVRINFDQLNYNLAYNGKIKDFGKVKHDHPAIELEAPKVAMQTDIFGEATPVNELKNIDL